MGGAMGRERWLREDGSGKSEIDPANSESFKTGDGTQDVNAWKGREEYMKRRAEASEEERSAEEERLVTLQPQLLERERFVTVGFWKLVCRGKWTAAPGGYPGPVFETKEEFTKGTEEGKWPLPEGAPKDEAVSDL